MAIPTTYTEAEVKQYMEDVLGDTADKLGWSVGGNDFDEPLYEVLYTLEKSDFTFVNTLALANKVRVVARREVWRAAMYYTAHEASFSAGAPGTGQTNRADVHRHCRSMFDLANAELLEKFPDLGAQDSRETTRWQVGYDKDYYGNQEE